MREEHDDALSETANGFVFGTGMPSLQGLRNALRKLDGENESVVWTCLREEPVIYINGKPFVLRNADEPVENIVFVTLASHKHFAEFDVERPVSRPTL